MTNLITLTDVSLAFGLEALLDKVKLQITTGERVCLIGRNGAGKSSLLKIIEGTLLPDSGSIWRQPHCRIARLQQTLPQSITEDVYEFVTKGLANKGDALAAYHKLTHQLSASPSHADLKKLESLQQKIDSLNAWQLDQEVKIILTKLALDPDKKVSELSGGWQRRAALARALVSQPSLLLLDEPTNHLDIEAIQWLEEFLLTTKVTLIFITHDRALLQRLATRIIELDRGQLTSWPGDYQNFLLRKAEMLHAQAKHHADFDKKLAEEEKWIRQGIKARRTRNEGRVRSLEAMRIARHKRRETEGKVSFNIKEADRSGQLVLSAQHITHSYNGVPIVADFSIRVMRGDRIGLIGPNGIGKSTLLQLLLGIITPQQGTVTLGTNLQIAYFDQLRAELDLEKTVVDNVSDGNDFVEVDGKQRHIISYLADFLFTPQRSRTKVKALSGGECNRLLLARLFSRPSYVLVMDEPTNDLDIETLELLEDVLCQYSGTLLLVSHDRKFLDNVVTSTLVFSGAGKITEYVGGYQDWLQQRPKSDVVSTTRTTSAPTKQKDHTTIVAKRRMTFKEQQELKQLPVTIERLEFEIAELQQAMARPQFYNQDAKALSDAAQKLKTLNTSLEAAYERWEILEAQSNLSNESK